MVNRFSLKEENVKKIVYVIEFCCIFFLLFRELFHLPSAISYMIDAFNCLIVFYFLTSKRLKQVLVICNMRGLFFSFLSIVTVCVFSASLNLVKFPLFIWSMRNTLRYYPLFFVMVAVWDEKDLAFFVDFLTKLQIPNLILVLIQFFILGYSRDNIGGIFGHEVGCNGYLNVYLCIVVTIVVEKYLHNKLNLVEMLFTIGSWLIISGFAELKIAFIEIPIIVGIAVIINKPTLKTIPIIIISIIGMIIGINLVLLFFPQWAFAFQNVKSLIDVGRNEGGGYNISRITAFTDINRLFFENSVFYNLFGLGFGGCENSSFDFLTSEFYVINGHYNYRWFSHQMWFLQCGYLGIIALLSFICTSFCWILTSIKKWRDEEGYGNYGIIFLVLMCLNFIYNSTYLTEAGYVMFAGLAITFVYYKNKMVKKYYDTNK